ncbi:MAG: autorepressor SdpR family transcription factor [Bacillota bacterium]|nr:autorepressor SdpR family transcription factor [Bacillota bacterium]
MNDEVFKALADPVRRKILEMLGTRNMSAGDIASNFDITAPSISRHLSILKTADLITDKREGQRLIYSLNTYAVREVIKWFYTSFGNIWIK